MILPSFESGINRVKIMRIIFTPVTTGTFCLHLSTMKLLKNIFILLWRLWFYFLVIITVFIALPVLIAVTSKEKYYPVFCRIANFWGKLILFLMGFRVVLEKEEELVPGKSYMFSANHTSMIDIMLMFAIMKGNPFVFVGKKELEKLPLMGYIYKRTMILVDRANAESRKAVFDQAHQKIQNGLSVCIFPEGRVPDDESIVLDSFKNGAFILSIEHQIPLVPITFFDNKKRFSYTFFSGSPGKLRVKMHKPIETTHMRVKEDKNRLKKQVFDIIYKDLTEDMNAKTH